MTMTTLFPTSMVVIYMPELETNRSINAWAILLSDLLISIRNLFEATKAISIPEKKADNKRQINMTVNIDISYLYPFQIEPLRLLYS